MNKIKVTGIQCPICEDQIWSRYRHDYRHCSCMYSSVDGGRSYLRYGWGCSGPMDREFLLTEEDWALMAEFNNWVGKPKLIQLEVPESESYDN